MIFRFILYGLLTIILFAIGLFVTPFNFWLRHPLRKCFPNTIWWFLNDTIQDPEWLDIDWGDYGRFKNNFIGFYQQNALRNSHWNLRMLLRPKHGDYSDIKGNLTAKHLKWNNSFGVTYGTFEMSGFKYFRLSWIIKIFKWYSYGKFGMGKADMNRDGTLKKQGRYQYVLKGGSIKTININ